MCCNVSLSHVLITQCTMDSLCKKKSPKGETLQRRANKEHWFIVRFIYIVLIKLTKTANVDTFEWLLSVKAARAFEIYINNNSH